MPRLKLINRAIDVLPTPAKDVVYWDSGCPGFGVEIGVIFWSLENLFHFSKKVFRKSPP